jgi:hypothetical protein
MIESLQSCVSTLRYVYVMFDCIHHSCLATVATDMWSRASFIASVTVVWRTVVGPPCEWAVPHSALLT